MYKTAVIPYTPNAAKMAAQIEETANRLWEQGYRLVTVTVTGSAKAILVLETRTERDAGGTDL